MSDSEAVHPRPQLVRKDWTDLCGTWAFAHDDEDIGRDAGWHDSQQPFTRTIRVPYPPESGLSGVHDPAYHPVVWYRREIAVPHPTDGERSLLHFGAVDYRATVWLDGVLVGGHEGGHTPFSCDITAVVGEGGTHVLVVRAEDQPTDATQPRGKQDWLPEPHAIWYRRTTGIWQPVWLEQVPSTYVGDLQWTADVSSGRVRMEVTLNHAPDRALSLGVRLRLHDEVLAEQWTRVDGQHAVTDIVIPAMGNRQDADRLLWSPENPVLIDAEVELTHEGRPVDQVASYLGLRSVGTGDGRFLLNDRPYFVRSVLDQGYWPESHLAAPDADTLRREVELVKEMGFNAVRLHQKVEDPRFLYWCDRLGLLVWGEMANAYEFTPTAVERLVREWLDVVRRDRSHPSVVTWVPLNESWGVQQISSEAAQRSYAAAVYHLTRAVDPTRPVVSNDGWEHEFSDIIGVHDYAPSGDLLTERYADADAVRRTVRDGRPAGRSVLLTGFEPGDRPVMLTEFGGVRYAVGEPGDGWGYSEVSSGQEYTERLTELVEALLDSNALAGFCYTQLTDTEQEQNGLLTQARKPKIPVEHIRAVVEQAAASIALEARPRPSGRRTNG
ncbi:MAG: glycoside hydrolase family 2 protein [Nocardioidaceae bacterium]